MCCLAGYTFANWKGVKFIQPWWAPGKALFIPLSVMEVVGVRYCEVKI